MPEVSDIKLRSSSQLAEYKYLMRPADEVEVVLVQKLGDYLWAEGEGDAAVVLTPAGSILLRVCPEKVTQEARVRNVRRSHHAADLLHRL